MYNFFTNQKKKEFVFRLNKERKQRITSQERHKSQTNLKLADLYRKRIKNYVNEIDNDSLNISLFKTEIYKPRECDPDKFLNGSMRFKPRNQKERVNLSVKQNSILDSVPFKTIYGYQFRQSKNNKSSKNLSKDQMLQNSIGTSILSSSFHGKSKKRYLQTLNTIATQSVGCLSPSRQSVDKCSQILIKSGIFRTKNKPHRHYQKQK